MTIKAIDLKTIFNQRVQKLPEKATIERYDPLRNLYTLIFPYNKSDEIYSDLNFTSLLRNLKEKKLTIIEHKTVEYDLEEEEGFLYIAQKVFEILFKDEEGVLNPKAEIPSKAKETKQKKQTI